MMNHAIAMTGHLFRPFLCLFLCLYHCHIRCVNSNSTYSPIEVKGDVSSELVLYCGVGSRCWPAVLTEHY